MNLGLSAKDYAVIKYIQRCGSCTLNELLDHFDISIEHRLDILTELGLIKAFHESSPFVYRLTHKGFAAFYDHVDGIKQERRRFIVKSILVPIVVSAMTTGLISLLKWWLP